ncbi:hypothetical protein N7448_009101 [Penicillium atrosanguineum]|uniref:Uncharacterized protein n=1 Tax=Penicillium atrosanguineum TaxID=1132637 RepID=A0A9W9Q472_9EURO|nr:hypothetical protein N7448_009101 [Penicillium atrosanguineum]KAJ5141636.1 hypothetical protein N7526_002631 [Penicillium atrosanguineum]KAJ5321507.1 hypothetical protein N7476_004509 [Penicillium atrosanguineum]
MNTTPQQILDIKEALVSAENPAHNDTLHNYFVAYGWMARNGRDTPDLDALACQPLRFWDEDTDSVRQRLDVSLNSFLDMI